MLIQRNYANLINTPRPSQGPTLASRIVELAVNRSGKAASEYPRDSVATTPIVPTKGTSTASTTSKDSPESLKEDLQSVSKDLELLSQLLGRPVSLSDLPNLTKEFPSSTRSALGTATVSTASSTSSRSTSSTSSDNGIRPTDYGKTDDAILAAVLKQRGIGPSHNSVPIEELFQTPRTTTARPRLLPPTSRRPILDGLAWLWRTWQDTAPRSNREPAPPSRPILQISGFQAYQSTQDNESPDNGGIDQDAIPVSENIFFFLFVYHI